jgi:predicted  nucleic acid-binding Zn-ribbon protein
MKRRMISSDRQQSDMVHLNKSIKKSEEDIDSVAQDIKHVCGQIDDICSQITLIEGQYDIAIDDRSKADFVVKLRNLRDREQSLREEKQSLRKEKQSLREKKQSLREELLLLRQLPAPCSNNTHISAFIFTLSLSIRWSWAARFDVNLF